MTRRVRLSPGALETIRTEARRAYPHEGCGALLGPVSGDVTRAIPLPNAEAESPRVRFVVSPRDYLAAEDRAEELGLRLLGIWHSHPDAPARPSATDRRFAWPELLTVVVTVVGGEPGEITAWGVADAEAPFQLIPIETPLATGPGVAPHRDEEVPPCP